MHMFATVQLDCCAIVRNFKQGSFNVETRDVRSQVSNTETSTTPYEPIHSIEEVIPHCTSTNKLEHRTSKVSWNSLCRIRCMTPYPAKAHNLPASFTKAQSCKV